MGNNCFTASFEQSTYVKNRVSSFNIDDNISAGTRFKF